MPADAKKVLTEFLDQMIAGSQDDMKALVAPSFKKKNKIGKKDYRVNNYGLKGFLIYQFDADNSIFTCHIWGEGQTWIHELTFKMAKEKGKWYIVPSTYDGEWVDPWTTVTAYVNENQTTETKKSNYTEPAVQKDIPADMKKTVSDFLDAMVIQDQDAMKAFISPEFKEKNKTEEVTYRINNYGVTGFIVYKFDKSNNILTAHIWGSSKNWVHELTFTLSKEGGKWYIVPSSFDGEWIDPWTKVIPYVNE